MDADSSFYWDCGGDFDALEVPSLEERLGWVCDVNLCIQ